MRSGKNLAKKGLVAEKGRAGWGLTSCISRQPIWRKEGKGEQGGESGYLPKAARWKGVRRSGVGRSDWRPSQPNKEREEAGWGKVGRSCHGKTDCMKKEREEYGVRGCFGLDRSGNSEQGEGGEKRVMLFFLAEAKKSVTEYYKNINTIYLFNLFRTKNFHLKICIKNNHEK